MEYSVKQITHLLFNPEKDLITIFKDGKLIHLSPAWKNLLGWELEEIESKNFLDFIHSDDIPATLKEIERVMAKGKSAEFVNRYITKDRNIKWIKWRSVINPENPQEIFGIGLDFTELYNTEYVHNLSQKEAKIGDWAFCKSSKKFSWSNQICDIYETPFDTQFVKVIQSHFHDEENWKIIVEAFNRCLEGETCSAEVQLITPNKKIKWISCWWIPNKIGNEVTGIQGLIQDISSSKANQKEIKEVDNRYEMVLSGINAGIWDWTISENLEQYWSPKLYEILKYSPDSFSPDIPSIYEIIHPDDTNKVKTAVTNLLDYNVQYNLEYRIKCGDGLFRWVQSSAIALRNEDGVAYRIIGTLLEVTEQKTAEAHLEEERQKSIQASKLATLGEMAAGLAHEVNNPLTIIFGYLRILEEEMKSSKIDIAQTNKFLGLIKSAADRAAKIVSSLKEFARDGAQDPFEDYPASDIINMVLELSKERLKKNDIRLDLEIIDDPIIHCRKLEISQVILNLLFNSFDAIQDFKQKWIKIQIKKIDGKISISITDCGHGLLPEVAEKIFTPFYTTKKTGQGTGLGLSISQRIIVNHGGEIFYDNSSLNTKFVIKLPLNYELA